MLANWITLSRIPLLGVIIALLYSDSAAAQLITAPLILLLILMDTFDGVLARARGETSLLGSVLDIAADRAVEYALWVVFAHLRLIPILVPLIVLIRGTFVDSVRSVAPARGIKPFDLMRTRLGRFLVGSPWLRTPFGVVKATAFILLALAYGLNTLGHSAAAGVHLAAQIASWGAVAFCLARGLPVLIEAPRVLGDAVEKS
ncbi:MAG: CDP-diacylglycerol--glycerol-3-phosphate 3-phosphatidyltransferase [Chloroflexi bacterium ADurb.Bin360]|nr:MAG: CDP-diacylglycerol--glycerol-3-phosphate 3-phosphatidyltransferase [Chloroflexi bacterium ADurb.Bin360]